MSITDPFVIRFISEQLRPLCEQVRKLKVQGSVTLLQWDQQVRALVPNNPNVVLEDGREAEGVSRLTGTDIHSAMSLLEALNAGIADEALPIINKPCVRSPLE